MPSLFADYMIACAASLNPDQVFSLMQSTFISYGGPDEAFAKKLHDRLRENGVTTFFYPETAEYGARNDRVMHEGVNKYDRVVLVCSRVSLDRRGVLNELIETFDREARDGGREYLIPIRIDDYALGGWGPEREDIATRLRGRVIADLSGTDIDDTEWNANFERLLQVLRKPFVPK